MQNNGHAATRALLMMQLHRSVDRSQRLALPDRFLGAIRDHSPKGTNDRLRGAKQYSSPSPREPVAHFSQPPHWQFDRRDPAHTTTHTTTNATHPRRSIRAMHSNCFKMVVRPEPVVLTLTALMLAVTFPSATNAAPECNISGFWTYTPEPGTAYRWAEAADGSLACFLGQDAWNGAVGHLDGNNVRSLPAFALKRASRHHCDACATCRPPRAINCQSACLGSPRLRRRRPSVMRLLACVPILFNSRADSQ